MDRVREEGVSSVVAAMLVFALFTTAFALWTAQSLPEWVEEREHHHNRGVADTFAQLSVRIGNQHNELGSTYSMRLAPDPVPVVQRAAAVGALSSGVGSQAWLNVSGETVYMDGGEVLGTVNGGPVAVGGTTNIAVEVASIDALLIRLASDNMGRATLSITDGSEVVLVALAKAPAAANCAGAGLELVLTTPSATRNHAILCEPGANVDYTLDVLSAPLPIAAAIASLGPAISLNLAVSDLDTGGARNGDLGYYAMVWRATDGSIQAAGGGSMQDADTHATGASLAFVPSYAALPDRVVRLDLGGVVSVQDDKAAFASTPPFLLGGTTDAPSLRWTLLDLDVTGSVSGAGSATIDVTVRNRDTTVLRPGSAATIDVVGPAAPAWRAHWETQLILNGFAGMAIVSGSGEHATLSFTNPSSWTIQATLARATIEVT